MLLKITPLGLLNEKGGSVVPGVVKRLGENEALNTFARAYAERQQGNSNLPPNLNLNSLEKGVLGYENLTGFKGEGYEITTHTEVPQKKLESDINLRKVAAGTSTVLSLATTVGLALSAKKLFSSAFGGGDEDEAHRITRNTFALGAIAGIANAASHENLNWGLGSLGMGLLGSNIDKPLGLALFSIFDGLNAMGMGEVNRRDKKNIMAITHSIFDKSILKKFEFLKPYENAIVSFLKRFTTKQGWRKTFSDEPYELFQSAGGGLILGGGLLGIASLFSKKMSEAVKSFLYFPYALTSLVNVIALGRDGAVLKERAHLINGRKPIETRMMDVEGLAKFIASPIIAINFGFLGFKGLGIDFLGMGEKVAMMFRLLGVATAYIGFAAQSAVKFAVPDKFGPKFKTIVEVILNPLLIVKNHLKNISGQDGKRVELLHSHESNFYKPILTNHKFSKLFEKVMNTPRFKSMAHRSLTSLYTDFAPERSTLNRLVHSIRVGAIVALYYSIAREVNPHFAEFLNNDEIEAGTILGGLLHDNGHADLPRCHLAETSVYGLNNDELSIKGILPGTELYKAIVECYIEEYGEVEGKAKADRVAKIARDVIAHDHPLSKLYKWADFCEYGRAKGSDYHTSFEKFPYWTKEDYEWLASQVVLYKDKNGDMKMGFTEEGGIAAFKQIYYRALFNGFVNYHPSLLTTDNGYKFGIQRSNLTVDQVFHMTESEFDLCSLRGAEECDSKSVQISRNTTGGEADAYCGWGEKEKFSCVKTDSKGNVIYEKLFTDHIEDSIRKSNPALYAVLKPMVHLLTIPNMLEMRSHIDPEYGLAKSLVASSEQTSEKKLAGNPNFAVVG